MARVAVLATEVPYAEQVWERTAADLDRYASEWTAMHIEACEATTLRGEQSVRVMDLRMACLHRARMSLEAATDVLASADAEVVARAHAVMAGLRPVSRCADVAALQADVDPPMPAEADAVQELRRKLAALYAARAAGRTAPIQLLPASTQRRSSSAPTPWGICLAGRTAQ